MTGTCRRGPAARQAHAPAQPCARRRAARRPGRPRGRRAAARRALRRRRHRQDDDTAAVGRGGRPPGRLGAGGRGRLRPRRPAHLRRQGAGPGDAGRSGGGALAPGRRPAAPGARPAAARRGARRRPAVRRWSWTTRICSGRRGPGRSSPFCSRGPPPGAQLAIGSRVDPPLHLARMRASGEVLEFGVRELAFGRDEVPRAAAAARARPGRRRGRRAAGRHRGLGDGPAARVPRRGGPSRPRSGSPRSAATVAPWRSYFTAEVLERQPAEVQDVPAGHVGAQRAHAGAVPAGHGAGGRRHMLARVAHEELFVVPSATTPTTTVITTSSRRCCEAELERGTRDGHARRTVRSPTGTPRTTMPDMAVFHLVMAGESRRPATWWPRPGARRGRAARPRPCAAGWSRSPTRQVFAPPPASS